MIDKKRVLALIPARKGSKGLPGKNIRKLCGKPLINWSIDKAKKSKYIDCILVSTDCKKTAKISKSNGAYVPFIRPKHLATDTASTFRVVEHALKFMSKNENKNFEYIVLLEPTSPLREDDDIDRMLDRLLQNSSQFDAIISIGEIDEHPTIVSKLDGLSLKPFCIEQKKTTRRQDNKPAYFPYGVAYIIKTDTLLLEKTFHARRSTFFKIKKYQNFEIDDIYDFLSIENVMKYEWSLK